MISVLVTGANGQLGKCLQDIENKDQNVKWVFKTSKELDITDQKSIQDLFKQKTFDYLVNCAAYTAVDKAESEKEKAFQVNAEAVKYLAEVCEEMNIVLIHISTDFVYDGMKGTPYTEEDEPNPINVYGDSKLKGEECVQKILKQFFIIRTSWVYSEHGHNFVKTMLRLGKERDEINIVNDQIGSPTYAGDLANFILFLIVNKEQKYGIYNYSNRGEISWYDFANEIFHLSNNKIILKPINSSEYLLPARRPVYSVLNNSKMVLLMDKAQENWKISLSKIIRNCLNEH